ncbi:MAG: hypothetical protein ACN4GW_02795 [Desulforhopalus sp.]
MLESKFNSPYCYCINLCTSISINDLAKKGMRELAYLFQLEDSTDRAGGRVKDYGKLEGNTTRGVVKAVFWIATSIIIPLLLVR